MADKPMSELDEGSKGSPQVNSIRPCVCNHARCAYRYRLGR